MNERTRRTRAMRKLAASLVAGAVLSIIIAIVAAVWSPVTKDGVALRELEGTTGKWSKPDTRFGHQGLVARDPTALFERLESFLREPWPELLGLNQVRTPGILKYEAFEVVHVFRGWGVQATRLQVSNLDSDIHTDNDTGDIVLLQSGWPFKVLEAHHINDATHAFPTEANAPTVAMDEWARALELPEWLHAQGRKEIDEIPAGLRGNTLLFAKTTGVGPGVIPYGIRWGGLLANTIIFVAVYHVARATVRNVRRVPRVHRGLCGKCGYDRASLSKEIRCPECGAEPIPVHPLLLLAYKPSSIRVIVSSFVGLLIANGMAWGCGLWSSTERNIAQASRFWRNQTLGWEMQTPAALRLIPQHLDAGTVMDRLEMYAPEHWRDWRARDRPDEYGFHVEETLLIAKGFGVTVESLSQQRGTWQRFTWESTLNIVRCGWPLRCVQARYMRETGHWVWSETWSDAMEPPTWLASTTEVDSDGIVQRVGMLPHDFDWLALGVNGLCYASGVWVLLAVARGLTASVRRRRRPRVRVMSDPQRGE